MLTIDSIKLAVDSLAEKYNLARVDLFGSYANGNATDKSDADLMVMFNVPTPSIFKVMGLKEELAMKLNNPVDIITIPAPHMDWLEIKKVINIYERA